MGFHKGRNQMSRLSKYVKEKIVKVLVAALVVGTVAGNEGIIAQAAEKNANIKNFLGEAINYGIVANEYMQANHMQTNFAVKKYSTKDIQGCGDDISSKEVINIVFGNVMTEGPNPNEYRYEPSILMEPEVDLQEEIRIHHVGMNSPYVGNDLETEDDLLVRPSSV